MEVILFISITFRHANVSLLADVWEGSDEEMGPVTGLVYRRVPREGSQSAVGGVRRGTAESVGTVAQWQGNPTTYGMRKSRVSLSVFRITIDSLLKVTYSLQISVFGAFVPEITTFQVQLVCLGIDRGPTTQACALFGRQFKVNLAGDSACHFTLQQQNVVPVPIASL